MANRTASVKPAFVVGATGYLHLSKLLLCGKKMPKKNAVCSPPLAMAERIFCPQRLMYTWREKKGRGKKNPVALVGVCWQQRL